MLSKEERERYEEQIRLIKEATQELKEANDEELVKCDICGEMVEEDYLSENDFITEGGNTNICQDCINDGYGR